MTRKKKESLRTLSEEEKKILLEISRSRTMSSVNVARAKALLLVFFGSNYLDAAHSVGYKSGDTVSKWVSYFNQEGLSALEPKHGGGPTTKYGEAEREKILEEFKRFPDREADGSCNWSLTLLQKSLRRNFPEISTFTIWKVLHESGYSWQRSQSWCTTGKSLRKRKLGRFIVKDPDCEVKKK